jgi:hypothetical protein
VPTKTPEQKMRGETRACAQLLGKLRRMINRRWRSSLRRFIVGEDESGWLDVRAKEHAVIACDNTAVVNGT